MTGPNILGREFKHLRSALTMYDRRDIKWIDKFARFGCIDPYNSLADSREYLFFTKPDLNIFDGTDDTKLNEYTSKLPYFCDLFNNGYIESLRHLQSSTTESKKQGPFMNMLSWSVTGQLDLPSVTSTATETSENLYGTTMQYMSSDFSSDEKFEFTLEFSDTKFLDIYNIFKAWVEYSRYKSRGLISPKKQYITNKILHDQIAIYKFIVDDTQTIIHFSKIWGVFPMNIPREVFGNTVGNIGISFSQSFMGTFVDDLDPMILSDFNTLVEPYCRGKKDMKLYNDSLGMVNTELASIPYVKRIYSQLDGYYRYKLMWRR